MRQTSQLHRHTHVYQGLIVLLILFSLLANQGTQAATAGEKRDEGSTGQSSVFIPMVINPIHVSDFLDTENRQLSRDFYQQEYLPYEDTPIDWTGSFDACDPGENAQIFAEAVLNRINYFRAMAGVPSATSINPEYSQKAQAAALMMSVNHQLDHTPSSSWVCYSNEGSDGASSSNLSLGLNGWSAVTSEMRDAGDGNSAAGHRRWILYPQTQEYGTGSIPSSEGFPASMALWVFDDHLWESRPEVRDGYVAWPPPGYTPYAVVFPRWSFSYPDADFSNATVVMSEDGESIPVKLEATEVGYGENTLVWIPDNLSSFDDWPKPVSDTVYSVKISNVLIDGAAREFSYTVTIFVP